MARTSSTPEVVCDAGPLIHLDELGCLDQLVDFNALLVPDAVWQEVAWHRPDALEQTELELTRTESLLPEDAQFLTLVRLLALDAGEPAALALMLQRPQAILLTDDAAARLAANQLGMRVHGRSAFCCERCGAVSVRHRKYSPCCALCQSDLQSTLALTR